MTEEFNKKKRKTQSEYGTVKDVFKKVSFMVLQVPSMILLKHNAYTRHYVLIVPCLALAEP